jgi:hypothetical protein
MNLTVTTEEAKTISRIVERAMQLAHRFAGEEHKLTTTDLTLDITACHANGCRLRLAELYAAETRDFTHDVFGIHHHINHETGQLMSCFSPRYRA